MKEYHNKSALELAGIINELTGEILFDKGESKALDAIHWISHELECRLGGHGGRKYATGPLLMEIPNEVQE